MYGLRVHAAVIEAGDQESGITIHYVDEHYDNGDIIFQDKCIVSSTDTPETLAEKIHAARTPAFSPCNRTGGKPAESMKRASYTHMIKWITVIAIFFTLPAAAQIRISGRVYDISKYRPLEAVSVITTSGFGTATDSLGRFSIITQRNRLHLVFVSEQTNA